MPSLHLLQFNVGISKSLWSVHSALNHDDNVLLKSLRALSFIGLTLLSLELYFRSKRRVTFAAPVLGSKFITHSNQNRL